MAAPEIFDRRRRRARRDRAMPGFSGHAFLIDHIGASLVERLDLVNREFGHALDLGCHDGRLGRILSERGIRVTSADAGFRFAAAAGGVQCDEDRLPFADGSFDLVVSAGVLDQVNDLPGALALIRRVLRPDGLFLAGFVGAGSLPRLRSATIAADLATTGAAYARIHPQIDVRSAGDLLSRAGFALPVADGERLGVRYRDPGRLLADLRGMAATSLLTGGDIPHFGRRRMTALAEALGNEMGEDDALEEIFALIFVTAWAPGPGQPQPARRGSGAASLASVLPPPARG